MLLMTVIENAIEHGLEPRIEGGEIRISAAAVGGKLRVSVADTGGGIPEEQINRIFEPFYTTKKKGSGLGLMIVQRIVRARRYVVSPMTLDEAARRELAEETGFGAGRLVKLFEGYLVPGYCNEYMHFFLFLALDLRPGAGR